MALPMYADMKGNAWGTLKKLGSVEEGARPEARQHKTDAIGKGLAEARDVEFERGHAESSAQKTIAQIAMSHKYGRDIQGKPYLSRV